MKTLKFSVALQLLIVFASGMLVGGLGYRLYSSQPPSVAFKGGPKRPGRGGGASFRERYVQEMKRRLALREEQVQKLNDILESTGRKFFEARKRADVEVRSLQENQQAQIRAMLDPPQIVEYEKMLQEREVQMKRDWEKDRKRRP